LPWLQARRLTGLGRAIQFNNKKGNMKIADKIRRKVNDGFTDSLKAEFKEKFKIEIESKFNIFAMQVVSSRIDEADFTPEQYEWIAAYEKGYLKAMELITP
jgi:hypothetical protein